MVGAHAQRRNAALFGWTDRILIVAATVSLVVLIPAFFSDRQFGTSIAHTPVVGAISVDKIVRRRHSKSLRWEDLRGNDAPVYLRDIVYTPKDTHVEVRLKNGESAVLPTDSLIQFDEVTLDNLQIALKERDLEVPRVRLLPLPRRSRIGELEDPVRFFAVLDSLTRRLHLAPRPELNQIAVPQLRGLASQPKMESLRDFEVRLIGPRSGETFSLNTTQWITMRWTTVPLPGVSFELQVSRSPIFSPLITYQTKADELSIQVEDPGAYYWRVSAKHGGKSMLSDSGTFTLIAARVDPSKAVSASLAGYAIEIARDAQFENIVRTAVASTPECPATGLTHGKYFCRASKVEEGTVVKQYSFDVK